MIDYRIRFIKKNNEIVEHTNNSHGFNADNRKINKGEL